MEFSRILLVDSDVRSARRPEASLTNAGHIVMMAWSGEEALEQIARETPDLVLSETTLAGMDGYELARRFRKQAEWSGIPFAFLTRSRAVEDRIRALELEVEDYLTKPIFVRDLVSRVNLLLSRRAPDSMPLPQGSSGARTRLSGHTSEVSLIDVLQTCEGSRKSAIVRVKMGADSGTIYVRDGAVVDAEVGRRRGEQAVYRILLWQDASFVVDFEPLPEGREVTVSMSTQDALLIEAMNRADAWARLCEKMPPLSTALRIHNGRWLELLRSLSDDAGVMLRLFDGKRSVAQAIDEGPYDDVSALAVVSQLYDQGVLVTLPDSPPTIPPGDASRPQPRSVPPLAYTLSATELLKRFSTHLRGPT
jgi:DNA-binding response OmpR family regulator